MAIFHLRVKPVSRATRKSKTGAVRAGRTATAAAAYRAGAVIVCDRLGDVHDYSRRRGVVSADIVLPRNVSLAAGWARNRSALWNAAERAEVRKDACVARELEVALPSELSEFERRRLALDFAQRMADDEGCGVDVAIHSPGEGGDTRNHHAHIMRTVRKIEAEELGAKLDTEKAGRNRAADLQRVRLMWEMMVNERLSDAGSEARIDHRTLAAQGIDRVPGVHLGPEATGFERRTGQKSFKRIAAEEAAELLAIAREQGELAREAESLRASILDLSSTISSARADRDDAQKQQGENRENGKNSTLRVFMPS